MNKLTNRSVELLGRHVVLKQCYKRLVVTDFSFMCEEARSAVDYLELCSLFDIVVMRQIPVLDVLSSHNSLRRFITFIDVLYDNHVLFAYSTTKAVSAPHLIFDIDSLKASSSQHKNQRHGHHEFGEGKDANASLFTLDEEIFALDRTISRLIEMQSEEYIKTTRIYKAKT